MVEELRDLDRADGQMMAYEEYIDRREMLMRQVRERLAIEERVADLIYRRRLVALRWKMVRQSLAYLTLIGLLTWILNK